MRIVGSYLYDVASRSRNIMNPSKAFCGLITIIQTTLWGPIKQFDSGFCQGLTKKQLKRLIKKLKKKGWMAISLDGAGFDSTQTAQIMACVDD